MIHSVEITLITLSVTYEYRLAAIMPSGIDMHNDTTNVENDMSNVMGCIVE